MTIETELRREAAALRKDFAIAERMLKENELDLAKEEIDFAKEELSNYIQKIEEIDGKKIGFSGLILRHTYHAPEEFMETAILLDATQKKLEKNLAKKLEKRRNTEDRANAKEKKSVN